MLRALLIIGLAIVCGGAAAVGVFQAMQSQPVPAPVMEVSTKTVFVASRRVGRGQMLTEEMISTVDWPAELVPDGAIESAGAAVGRVALTTIMPREPLFAGKLTDRDGQGFIASIVKPGMRAYTIQTRGPSASVAGFVRPQDRVDVLVNFRGSTSDETGGGSTTTLLQAVEILAIDQILDPNPDPLTMLEMWTKGDSLTSVTLQVTPTQASLLALGQANGELSLTLRSPGDEVAVETIPATIRDIRMLEMSGRLAADQDPAGPTTEPPGATTVQAKEPPAVTYIQTVRGSQTGRIDLLLRP